MGARVEHVRRVLSPVTVLTICLLSLGVGLPVSAAIGHSAVENMLSEAEQQALSGKFNEALAILQRILQIEPQSADAWEWVGFCYLALGQRDAAIEAYAAHLKLEPESEQGWAAMNRLFFDFQNQAFPASLDPDILPVLPVTIEQGSLLTPGQDGAEAIERRFAWTTSVVFPEPMAYSQEMRVPSATAADGVNPTTITDPRRRGLYNRVSYGYVLNPDSARLELKLAVHYPSPALTEDGSDATEIAHAVTATLLRLWWLSSDILGRVPLADRGPLNVWLTTQGEAGGEQWKDNLFLYELRRDRDGAEWLREIAHEWGHLLIPGIDGFEQPERWASGAMGEALLLKWLAESAAAGGDDAGIQMLWPGKVDLAPYFANHNDALLRRFLLEGPNSALLVDRSQAGMDYLVGLALFAEAAHGPSFIRQLFDVLGGDQPPDLIRAYKEAVRAAAPEGLSFDATVNVPLDGGPRTASTVGEPVPLTLQPGQKAQYWVYLPDGTWTMKITASTDKQAVVGISADDAAEVGAILQPGTHVTGEVVLGQQPDGWKRIAVSLANADSAVTLHRFTFVGSEVGPSPFATEQEATPAQENTDEGR